MLQIEFYHGFPHLANFAAFLNHIKGRKANHYRINNVEKFDTTPELPFLKIYFSLTSLENNRGAVFEATSYFAFPLP